jgi:hypothetical protein
MKHEQLPTVFLLVHNNILNLTDFYKTTKMKLRLVLFILPFLSLYALGQGGTDPYVDVVF